MTAGHRIATLLATLLLAHVVCDAAEATDKNGNFNIMGAGSVTCDYYLKASEQERVYAETWWAGYATAINRTTDETYSITGKTSSEQVNDAIRKACRANPKALLANTVHDVLEGMFKNRTKLSPN